LGGGAWKQNGNESRAEISIPLTFLLFVHLTAFFIHSFIAIVVFCQTLLDGNYFTFDNATSGLNSVRYKLSSLLPHLYINVTLAVIIIMYILFCFARARERTGKQWME